MRSDPNKKRFCNGCLGTHEHHRVQDGGAPALECSLCGRRVLVLDGRQAPAAQQGVIAQLAHFWRPEHAVQAFT